MNLRRRNRQTNPKHIRKLEKLKREYQNLMENVDVLLTDEYKNNETQMIKAITISRIDEYETKLGEFYQDALLQIHHWKLDLQECKSLKVQMYVPEIRTLLDDTTVYNSDVDTVNTSSKNVSKRCAGLEVAYKTLKSRYDEIKKKLKVSSESIFQPDSKINWLLTTRPSVSNLNTDDFERDDTRPSVGNLNTDDFKCNDIHLPDTGIRAINARPLTSGRLLFRRNQLSRHGYRIKKNKIKRGSKHNIRK